MSHSYLVCGISNAAFCCPYCNNLLLRALLRGKMLQMVSTSQSATPQLAGFHLAALPRAAIQLAGAGGGPQVLMLCPQSQQQQQQQQPVQNSPLSSVIPVMVAASNSQQLASSK